MAKRVLLIVNPKSGDGIAVRWVADMVSMLSKKYDFVTVYFSKKQGDILNIASGYSGEYEAMVVVGGDGSLNEAIGGILLSGTDIDLGYVPTGTVNDFATSHGIPKNIKMALEKIADGEPKKCDVGSLNGRFFSYVATFGAFTDVAYLTSQKSKETFGKIAYVAEAATRILKLKPIKMTYELDGERVSGEYIYGMASNSKTIGGIVFYGSEGEEFLRDGELEITLVKYPFSSSELSSSLVGLINPSANTKQVVKFRTSSIKFEFEEETPFTVDGEFGGSFSSVDIKNIEGALSLIE